ncbi:hypothetical protein CROQUDRAFT_652369, partial [Cronartium quercuum f. sp. fusiforme G11]
MRLPPTQPLQDPTQCAPMNSQLGPGNPFHLHSPRFQRHQTSQLTFQEDFLQKKAFLYPLKSLDPHLTTSKLPLSRGPSTCMSHPCQAERFRFPVHSPFVHLNSSLQSRSPSH